MSQSRLSMVEYENPPQIKFEVKPDPKQPCLVLEYSVKNTSKEPMYVFQAEPPFVRIRPDGQVYFMSLMPELTPWSRPVAPTIPAVVRLDAGESFEGKAEYKLPLIDNHPYPASPVKEVPIPTEKSLSTGFCFQIGYFPEKDANTLFEGSKPGEKVPSYYELKRQYVTTQKRSEPTCAIQKPI